MRRTTDVELDRRFALRSPKVSKSPVGTGSGADHNPDHNDHRQLAASADLASRAKCAQLPCPAGCPDMEDTGSPTAWGIFTPMTGVGPLVRAIAARRRVTPRGQGTQRLVGSAH